MRKYYYLFSLFSAVTVALGVAAAIVADRPVRPLAKQVSSERPAGVPTSLEVADLPSVFRKSSVATPGRGVSKVNRAAARDVSFGGALHYSSAWTESSAYGLYSFKSNPGSNEKVSLISEYYFFEKGNGAVYDNAIHVVDFSEWEGVVSVNYNKVNILTGEYVDYESMPDLSFYTYDCDYDPLTGGVIGCFSNADNSAVELAMVDYDTRARKTISKLPDILFAVGVNSKGEVYGIDGGGVLRKYDRNDGSSTEIFSTGLIPSYMQSATFDRETDLMYWAFTNGSESALYEIDVTVPSITKLYDFDNSEEFTCIYVQEEFNGDVPGVADGLSLDFGAGVSGSVTFTLPSVSASGESLGGNVEWTLYANGVMKAEGKGNPGDVVKTREFTAEEGENWFVVKCSNEAGESAPLKVRRWIGKGQTEAPSNLSTEVNGTKVSLNWNAPEKGVLDAYFEPSELTYTVTRYPEGKVIAENISQTSLEDSMSITNPIIVWYGITANNVGYNSDEAVSTKIHVGDVFSAPWYEDFENPDNFEFFTVIDSNNDGRIWMVGLHQGLNPTGFAFCNTNKYGLQGIEYSDDWLLSPEIELSADDIYEFDCKVWSAWGTAEEMEVALGQGDDPTAAGKYEMIIERTQITRVYEDAHYFARTWIPASDGRYRVAFHGVTGINGSNINIDELHLYSVGKAGGPAAVADLTAVPDAKGEIGVTLSFTTPSRNAADTDAVAELSKVEIFRDGVVAGEFNNVKAGQSLTWHDDNAAEGSNTYRVVCYSGGLKGMYAEVQAFAGFDLPANPLNLMTTDKGDRLEITWDASGNVGKNGGYVDIDEVTYTVYAIEGMYAQPIAENLKETTYVVSNTATGPQSRVIYGVAAIWDDLLGDIEVSNTAIVGKPHALPFMETFNMAKCNNEGWEQPGDIEHRFYTDPDVSCDAGSTSMGWAPAVGYREAWLNSGKIAPGNAENLNLIFDWMTAPEANTVIEVIGVVDASNTVALATIDCSKNTEEGWHTEIIDLNKWRDAASISIKFHVTGNDLGSYIWLDRIQVRNILGKDLIAGLSAKKSYVAGKEDTVSVRVENNSFDRVDAYKVNLYVDGDLYASRDGEPLDGILSGNFFSTVDFGYSPSVFAGENASIHAEVVLEGDMDIANNTTSPYVVNVVAPVLESPSSLALEEHERGVALSWVAPEIVASDVMEDFESYNNGDLVFGNWKTYDGDKGLACGINGIDMPHAQEPIAFMVFNPEESGMNLDNRPLFAPMTDDQYLIAQTGWYSSASHNDDWLISPELSGEAQTIEFLMAKIEDYYKETFEIYYSLTDDEISSFILLESGEVELTEWDLYSYDLPEGAKYFALRYTAADQFMIMIDDLSYSPKVPELKGYRIYRNGSLLTEVLSEETSYNVEDADANNGEYAVTAVYDIGESMPSNRAIVSGVEDVLVYLEIAGKTGEIVCRNIESDSVEVYSLDGKLVRSVTVDSDEIHIKVEAGVYMVKAGEYTVKVIVK